MKNTFSTLRHYYLQHLAKYGDTALGAAWPDENGRNTRFQVCVDIITSKASTQHITVCDLGCGTGAFLNHIRNNKLHNFNYIGVDILEESISVARKKFPDAPFYAMDVLHCADEKRSLIACDFIVANGLFTVKSNADEESMWNFMTAVIEKVWPHARQGIIFNIMSKIVDWERDDLFHVSYDRLAGFLHGLAGRHIGFQADYGLYEYMAYALKPIASSPTATQTASERAREWDQDTTDRIFHPRLPTLSQIAPYLETIDQNRWYSNHGSLSRCLSARLSSLFGLKSDELWLTSSGTAGLVGAILAFAGRAQPDRPLALCPAYTFVATANAAEMAGYQPYFVDVDARTWAFEPDMAKKHPLLDKAGLILVTAPYGQTLSQRDWTEFWQATGIPVVVDAAGAFENVSVHRDEMTGLIPIVLSLHATKAFSCGEGGVILCRNPALRERMTAALNFGFFLNRRSQISSTNGKMSEYHAAVGLAELDNWSAKQIEYLNVEQSYRNTADILGIRNLLVIPPRIASCYVLVLARDFNEAESLQYALRIANIPFRQWYGPGLHLEPAFSDAPHDDLPNTEKLGQCLLGLPMAPDMPATKVHRILTVLAESMQQAPCS